MNYNNAYICQQLKLIIHKVSSYTRIHTLLKLQTYIYKALYRISTTSTYTHKGTQTAWLGFSNFVIAIFFALFELFYEWNEYCNLHLPGSLLILRTRTLFLYSDFSNINRSSFFLNYFLSLVYLSNKPNALKQSMCVNDWAHFFSFSFP